MNAMRAREVLIDKLDSLSDEQVAALLELVRVMQPEKPHDDYNEADDPLLTGELSFAGPVD